MTDWLSGWTVGSVTVDLVDTVSQSTREDPPLNYHSDRLRSSPTSYNRFMAYKDLPKVPIPVLASE